MTAPDRFPLTITPTPLRRAPGLEDHLGSGPIWVKRDDLIGFAVAGNKARPLEYLIGDALAHGADVLVATGSPTSNFCPAAALAARRAGLYCELIHSGAPPADPPVTMRMSEAAGAQLRFDPTVSRADLDEVVHRRVVELRKRGRRPYSVPRGGATAIGGVGFAVAAQELATQCAELDIEAGTIVIPTGSGGTQAGLLAGRAGSNLPLQVVGASVSRPVEEIRARVHHLAGQCARLLGTLEPSADDVEVRDAVGAGFGVASVADRESAHLALTAVGLLLDDTYGAKAMTVLRALTRESDGPFIFWCTGGLPSALHALEGPA
ncbi:1-aminocyclopropane-1-carboxylate deaminase/D-cysteine desulfhydrase [Leekyejoonella antrihumi]|nr:pyridoxal-phosphate dependent enzyme [Leekyejoonella antrihumi]